MSNKIIHDIKRFNRFYTRASGLVNIYNNESPYSASEALILFEIHYRKDCTAAYLSNFFFIDKSHMSRMLKHFELNGLITKKVSEADRRIQYIEMTDLGGEVLKSLANKADLKVQSIIDRIPEEEIHALIEAMQKIEKIMSTNFK